MENDAIYSNIDVQNTVNAKIVKTKYIHAEKMILENNEIDFSVGNENYIIKELYESNKNTNCFTDIYNDFMQCLYYNIQTDKRNVRINVPSRLEFHADDGIFFNIIDDIDYEYIPENKGVWCFNEEYGMIFKYRKNGILYYSTCNTYEWKLPVKLEVIDEHVRVNINTI